jgi:UDP-N-acetylglucosamine 2-epimerase (non-hydrolysing)
MGIKVAHVEAGLRSFDRTMPEELNRILTDSVADYLFVTEESGLQHLKNEGVADERVFFSGNVMIDSLVRYQEKAKTTTILEDLGLRTSDSGLATAAERQLSTSDYGLSTSDYIVMTMHRPANVDTKEGLESILELIELSSKDTKIIFPIHPRTRAHMEKFGLAERLDQLQNLIMTEPLGYLEFIQLMSNATAILTDSGGIQEETTYLGVPCLTFRDSTERPITVTLGTNQLLSDLDPKKTYAALQEILAGKVKKGSIPPLWDGKAAERIAAQLAEIFA